MTIEIKKVKNGYIVRPGGYDSGRLTLDHDFQVFETMDGLVEHLRATMEPESKPGPGFKFTTEELTPDWAKKSAGGDLTACVDAHPKIRTPWCGQLGCEEPKQNETPKQLIHKIEFLYDIGKDAWSFRGEIPCKFLGPNNPQRIVQVLDAMRGTLAIATGELFTLVHRGEELEPT